MTLKAIGMACVLLCPCVSAAAQSVSTLMGARGKGMGNSTSCLPDEWSLFNNPGGLASIKGAGAATAYDKTPALPGSDRMAAVAFIQFMNGTLSAGVFRFGDALYNEQVLTAGFGNRFGLASLGAKVNLIQYNAEGFGTRSMVSVSFGGIAELTPAVKVGAHIININQPVVSHDNNERLPTVLTAGMAVIPDESLIVTAEVAKDLDYKPTWKAGIEYKPLKKVSFRSGFNLIPSAAFFGVGFRSDKLVIDYALEYAVIRGTCHQVSAIYSIRKK